MATQRRKAREEPWVQAMHDGPPYTDDQQRHLIGYAARSLKPWFGGMFEPAAQLYMSRLLLGIYAAYYDGLLMTKTQALRHMSAVDGRTSQRYLALAKKHGLIRIKQSILDKRVDLLCPTTKLLALVRKQLALMGSAAEFLSEELKGGNARAEHTEPTSEILLSTAAEPNDPGIVARISETIHLVPTHAPAYRKRADALLSLGYAGGALSDLAKAIKLAPRMASLYADRGLINLRIGSDPKFQQRAPDYRKAAIDDFSKAIELAPTATWYYTMRGKLLASRGDYDAAIQDLTEAIRCAERADERMKWQPLVDRAKIHEQRGDLDAAIADMEAALRVPPKPDEPPHGGLIFSLRDLKEKRDKKGQQPRE